MRLVTCWCWNRAAEEKSVRHKPTHSSEEAKVDLTPMLDIVFIMLIFFIVTATFVQEAGLDVTKPDSDTPPQSAIRSMRIYVTDTDRILIDGVDVDTRAIRARVERFIGENPKGSIVVQTDKRAKTGTVVRALDQAKLVTDKVSIATTQE